jgi:hypothetical protein
MKREQLHNLRSKILDKMAYVLVYAPNFPAEDRTSLQQCRDRLTAMTSEHRASVRTDDQLKWHRIAEQELDDAFNAFAAGDTHRGCSQIQRSEEHFRKSFKAKPIRPNFVVAMDGQIIKT